MSTDGTQDDVRSAEDKVEAGGDALQAESEQKLAQMAGNADLADDAEDDAADAAKRARDARD